MTEEATDTRLSEAAFEGALVGMAVLGTDGRWLRVNQTLCRTLGYTAGELEATSFHALLMQSDRTAELDQFDDLCAGRRLAYQTELQVLTKAGIPRWVRSSLALALDPDGHVLGVVAQIEDIDGRHDLDDTTTTSMGELRRSNTELEVFAAVAAHDLQEPLRKIRTFGDRLEQRFGEPLGPDGLDYLRRMQAAAARMQQLIDDLLAYARISLRGQPFVAVDLDVVAAEASVVLETRLEHSGGRLEIGALPTIDADPVQMHQLFQNLLGNAIKFAAPERPPIVVVEADTSTVPGSVTILVRDNGIGFDPIYAGRIFEAFERLHGRSEYAGTGIGLAICRRIVERHGGSITADARLGEGACITLSLPITHVERPT